MKFTDEQLDCIGTALNIYKNRTLDDKRNLQDDELIDLYNRDLALIEDTLRALTLIRYGIGSADKPGKETDI